MKSKFSVYSFGVFILAFCLISCKGVNTKPRFEGEPLAICGDNELVIVDASRSEGDSLCVLWSWKTDDEDFMPLDECKPIDNWHKILIASSRRAAAILDTDTGELIFKAVTPMAHSIEMLPGNRIAVALSTHTSGNSLHIYDIDNPSAPIIKDTMYSGHGVVWNAGKESLFTLNYDEVREYKLVDWTGENPSIRQVNAWPIPGVSGHDLSPVDDGRMIVTDDCGTYLFDIESGTFTTFAPLEGLKELKSVNYDPVTERLVYTVAEIDWWTHHVYLRNPDMVLTIDSLDIYKVRTLR